MLVKLGVRIKALYINDDGKMGEERVPNFYNGLGGVDGLLLSNGSKVGDHMTPFMPNPSFVLLLE